MTDIINNPEHYTKYPVDVIEIINWLSSNASTPYEGYLVGTVVKYLFRYPHKNGVEDLKKARWFLDKLIEELSG